MTADGGFLLADTGNNRIRKISPNGTITTVVGNGNRGYSGDGGPAASATIDNPRSVIATSDGGFLFPDTGNHVVRRVSPTGTITTVAGTGIQGFSGDGGPATGARLSSPFGVSPLPDGGFLIADKINERIRRVAPDGTITTVAGNGVAGFSGDGGMATAAALNDPDNVSPTSDGGFLIADASNHRIRKVNAFGAISTFAGTGVAGFSGEGGPADAAQLANPKAVVETPSGNVLIADSVNNRVRFVGAPSAPASVIPPGISGVPRSGQTLTAFAGGWTGVPPPAKAYQWQRCDASGAACVDIAFANATTYVVQGADLGSTVRVVVTATNVAGSAAAQSAPTSVVTQAPAPPVNTSPPTISGTPIDGAILTANPGTWSGATPISYLYQWQRCDAGGSFCQDISPAGDSASYVVKSADVGATLRVLVGATNADGTDSYASAVTADNAKSYWRFNDSGGTLSDRRGFKSGVYANSPQRGAPGLIVGDTDTAASFNGTNQYADVPTDPVWTAGSFSVELSVKPSSLPDNRTVWSTASSFGGWWLNTNATGALRFFIGNGSAWQQGPDGPVLSAGVSHHIVATYDGTNARLYVDGSLVSTGPAAVMARDVGGNVMRFGAPSPSLGQFWPGVLDDASFYPFALSGAQVTAHYQQSQRPGSSATSNATAAVTASPPVNTGLPVVSGSAVEGQSLSASSGSWSGTAPFSYAYQWRRCDAAGAACV
ncbi:MAG TPA: LamG-like jellyroll fold domain-containing protein, partial [Gaiellaceae bacterium]